MFGAFKLEFFFPLFYISDIGVGQDDVTVTSWYNINSEMGIVMCFALNDMNLAA